MKVGSKTLMKLAAIACSAFQGFAIYKGQTFNPVLYCTAITMLFGANSVHENVGKYLDNKNQGGTP